MAKTLTTAGEYADFCWNEASKARKAADDAFWAGDDDEGEFFERTFRYRTREAEEHQALPRDQIIPLH